MAALDGQTQRSLWADPQAPAPAGPDAAPPYYRIGQVAELLGVEPHVVRYWEKEFPQLKPVRAGSRQRLYHVEHLEMLQLIKQLLHEQRYTIEGARQRLDELISDEAAAEAVPAEAAPPAAGQPALEEIKAELRELIELLAKG